MNKCPKGSYYCYTDKKCKPIPKGMKTTARFSGGGREPEEVGIDKHLTVMATAMVMVEMEADLVKEVFISGLKDPNQKMVKVVGSTLSLVAHVPVMNQERELQNAYPLLKEQV